MHSDNKPKGLRAVRTSTRLMEKRLQGKLDQIKNIFPLSENALSRARKSSFQLTLSPTKKIKTREETLKSFLNNLKNPFAPLPCPHKNISHVTDEKKAVLCALPPAPHLVDMTRESEERVSVRRRKRA